MDNNIITNYLKVQLNRDYDNKNYFVDGDDFLDNGLEDYTEYSHNWQAFITFGMLCLPVASMSVC